MRPLLIGLAFPVWAPALTTLIVVVCLCAVARKLLEQAMLGCASMALAIATLLDDGP